MKKLLFFFMLLGSLSSVVGQSEKTPFSTRSLSNDAIKQVHVETSGGSIAVSGVAAGEARIEVYVQPSNGVFNSMTKEEIQKKLDEDYDLTISVANNQLTAIAKARHSFMNWKKALSISFKVFVQKETGTDLSTSGGSIHLNGLSGTQSFRTSGGSLHVDDVTGNITGKTSGGSITVKHAGSNIDLSTSGGSIYAEDCNGAINLYTSGGSLTLNNLHGNIKAKTSGGSVHANNVQGDLSAHTSGGSVTLNNLSGSLETSTSGGSINADIKELGKFVTISNSGGNVNLTLPENKGLDLKLYANKIHTDALKNFTGKADDDEISGTVNGGGVPITVKASSGHLNVKM